MRFRCRPTGSSRRASAHRADLYAVSLVAAEELRRLLRDADAGDRRHAALTFVSSGSAMPGNVVRVGVIPVPAHLPTRSTRLETVASASQVTCTGRPLWAMADRGMQPGYACPRQRSVAKGSPVKVRRGPATVTGCALPRGGGRGRGERG